MKKLMMAAAASTLLGGCAYYAPSAGENVAAEGRYVPTGSNIPRKKGEGTSVVSTMSAVELESARMNPGTAPELPPGQ
ncbi:hypothetical protein [Massilia sp. MS-15]|uniref:hypothetical protein n=1 Tax=Massilia sp. MS-15 TaxID=2878200 RepID=UPI001CD63FD8|nr:hypothetical protein [Massilia sp. MS-15]MCA1245239.1 hypothetical protein [Massilia sp. MS-15]